MAAFSYPATFPPQMRHTRTTTQGHQRTGNNQDSAVTACSDDNFNYYAPPLARNAFPATPARFMSLF
ncbi:hypothetical protein DXF91_10865 [Enterobacter roggenkampii]|uniref:Uncharacterized protein n=1 Tax=Enterobacter roggenkampii TaxID=1812935 RepID=A0ABD7GPW5_9ENTR|nr:hypothetical protein DXF88_10530 [Enterobacter roggenkampii]RDT22898.1 hypothetical protein DXF91_10865 [Enterobacter roggenkampii]RDT40587.1 hypothetical protein DXF89_09965 [Enterobacter roggenkampii]RDT56858.1 hypothetical protein DXF87_24310 [Enterobacter roggenkampii]